MTDSTLLVIIVVLLLMNFLKQTGSSPSRQMYNPMPRGKRPPPPPPPPPAPNPVTVIRIIK
jgi:hypothetical protein